MIKPILLVDLAKWYGGVDVRVLDMARALNGRFVYTVAVLADSPLHQKLVAENLNVLPLSYSRSDPRLFWAIYQTIKRDGYQIVDAHNPQSQFWGLLAAKLARVPLLVSSVHTIYTVIPGGRKGRVYDWVLRLNRRWGCQFMTVSSSIVTYLQDLGVPPEDVSLIYNGVTPKPTVPARPNLEIRKQFCWGAEHFVLVVVGRLETQKGHTYLIDAVHELASEVPQLRCLIVGEGRLLESLTAQTESYGLTEQIHFAGFRDDVTAVLEACDLFCLPSITEGLPFALLEACAQGLPSLVSDVDGMGELFTHKETTYLVPSTDIPALADGIRWFMQHPTERAAIGNAAYQLVKTRLNPDTMVDETLAVYRQADQTLGNED